MMRIPQDRILNCWVGWDPEWQRLKLTTIFRLKYKFSIWLDFADACEIMAGSYIKTCETLL